jgi:hypothetical protein
LDFMVAQRSTSLRMPVGRTPRLRRIPTQAASSSWANTSSLRSRVRRNRVDFRTRFLL